MNDLLDTKRESTLERIEQTPEARHVPPREVVLRRIDVEFRRKLNVLWDSVDALTSPADGDLHLAFEQRTRYLIRWFERLTHLARGAYNPPHGPLRDQLNASIDGAVAALAALDPGTFRRRTPFHLFDRSRAELIYGAFVVVECAIASLAEQLSRIDGSLREKLLDDGSMPEITRIEDAKAPETVITGY